MIADRFSETGDDDDTAVDCKLFAAAGGGGAVAAGNRLSTMGNSHICFYVMNANNFQRKQKERKKLITCKLDARVYKAKNYVKYELSRVIK